MRQRSSKRRIRVEQELNITAFLNLMVVLIPFLLVTTVFSRITVLDMHIPPAPATTPAAASVVPAVRIIITLRAQVVEVSDGQQGILQRFPRSATGYDLPALTEFLQRMKDRVPDKRDATLLVERNIPYQTLVEVMDATRSIKVGAGAARVMVDLFPDLSIGEAPPS